MYREPSRQESTIIKRFFNRWGVFDYFNNKYMLIYEKDKKRDVFLLSPYLKSIINRKEPCSAGLHIGELKKQFFPSLQLIDLVARINIKRNFPYVTINDVAENLFLYGRDIFGESVIEASANLSPNQLVAILNKRGDAVGLGLTRYDYKTLFQRQKVTITNIFDAGLYLRMENAD